MDEGSENNMNNEERIAKLAKIWVEWNNPIADKISGDHAMSKIGDLFKKECLFAWNIFVKEEEKQRIFALSIKHKKVKPT